jgi:hypothetical protein
LHRSALHRRDLRAVHADHYADSDANDHPD